MTKKYISEFEKNILDIIVNYQTGKIDNTERCELLSEATVDFKNLIIDHFIC